MVIVSKTNYRSQSGESGHMARSSAISTFCTASALGQRREPPVPVHHAWTLDTIKHHPDLMLVDLGLLGIYDGVQIAQRAREDYEVRWSFLQLQRSGDNSPNARVGSLLVHCGAHC